MVSTPILWNQRKTRCCIGKYPNFMNSNKSQISFRLKTVNWFWKYKEISNRVMHPPIILEFNKVCSLVWIFTGCYEDYKGMVNAITKETKLVWANSLTVMTKVW